MRLSSLHKSFARRGAITAWVVLSLGIIIGILALGMDGGRMMEERRRGQAAADAAALAAAADLYANYGNNRGLDLTGSARGAAVQSAAANGYANDGTTSVVTVNVPPTSGAFTGQKSYVEVNLEIHQPAGFSGIFTRKGLVIKARAVARGRPAKIGLLLLRPGGADALLNKALLFTVVGNPIIVNSSDPAAFDQSSPGVVLATSIQLTGGLSNPGGGVILGPVHTGETPTPDPLRYLPAPSTGFMPVQSAAPLTINSILPTILNPGLYRGGIQITGLSTVVLNPGIYVMDGGGLTVDSLASVAGVEVMIYNTSGTYPAGAIAITSVGKVVLVPPLSGTYQGVGIFQDRAVSQPIALTGFGLTAITGTIYAPLAPVQLNGLAAVGVDTLGGSYICASMQVQGIGGINVDLGTNFLRVPDVTLVE